MYGIIIYFSGQLNVGGQTSFSLGGGWLEAPSHKRERDEFLGMVDEVCDHVELVCGEDFEVVGGQIIVLVKPRTVILREGENVLSRLFPDPGTHATFRHQFTDVQFHHWERYHFLIPYGTVPVQFWIQVGYVRDFAASHQPGAPQKGLAGLYEALSLF
ncbi:hypothetical protein B0H17DRAFT_1130414 [Mycena rosella]|uniref:Uncharacterized protein n=1 Tax=Mycena rosella TaxID=1033263 RepID=A0AAD7DT38_MYCRO|nr:hypothetical protein B0H17DRAFT_1130414 [Mycena rosella]